VKGTVGKVLPRELEKLLTLRAIRENEGPSESDGAVEGRLRQGGIRAGKEVLFVQVAERSGFYHAATKGKAVT
jgi:hypothetical protein